MARFTYRALSATGEIVTGEVDASSLDEVSRRIEYLGHLPIDAAPARTRTAMRFGLAPRRPRRRDVTVILREIGFLLGAGLTLEEALQMLAQDAVGPAKPYLAALIAAITEGQTFADALARDLVCVPASYVAMVRAGEATGRLAPSLAAIVEDRERSERLSERVAAAIRYPLFLVAAAILVLLFFLLHVVPQFEPVFRDIGGDLNAGAGLVLAVSAALRQDGMIYLAVLLTIMLPLVAASRTPAASGVFTAVLATMPGLAGPLRDRRTARFVGSLGLLVGSGVPLPSALKLLEETGSDPRSRARLARLREQVRNGRRFCDALAEIDLLPPLAVRMLKVGEEAGALPEIAAQTARFYEHKLQAGLQRLMGAVGPITIVLVSLLVGGLVVSIMTALLSLTELAT